MRMKIEEIHPSVEGLHLANNDVEARDIFNWLSSSDPSTNHSAAKLLPKYGLRIIQ